MIRPPVIPARLAIAGNLAWAAAFAVRTTFRVARSLSKIVRPNGPT